MEKMITLTSNNLLPLPHMSVRLYSEPGPYDEDSERLLRAHHNLEQLDQPPFIRSNVWTAH